jgi:pimeloyl-ACP methyl ester carboxylesterase
VNIKIYEVSSMLRRSNLQISFPVDVKTVRDAIAAETTQGRDVVVVVHSYGGMVGQSAIKGLSRPKEQNSDSSASPSGHAIGLAMMATGFCQTGMSFLDVSGGKPPPFWKIDPSGFAVLTVDTRELFYHDLPEAEGNLWVSKLRPHSLKSLSEGGEHAYSGWRDVPVWLLETTDDRGLPLQAQQIMVAMVRGAGEDVTVREIDSSHSPMLSKPRETAEFIDEAARAFTA